MTTSSCCVPDRRDGKALRLSGARRRVRQHTPPVEEAADISGTAPRRLNVKEGAISNVKVTGKHPTRLRVRIKAASGSSWG
ncbi:MAG: hypothetical protein ACLT4Y_12095 [Bifidobacterium breve]